MSRPARPSAADAVARTNRETALHNSLAVPIPTSSLTMMLDDSNWDVHVAVHRFWSQSQEERDALTRPLTCADRPRTHRPSNSEARVDALYELRERSHRTRPPGTKHRVAEAVALLHRFRWDVEGAAKAHNDLNGNLSEFTNVVKSLRSSDPNQEHKDQRLSDFITFTDADNWLSALQMLEGHKWDVVQALDQWYFQDGIFQEPMTSDPKGKAKARKGARAGRKDTRGYRFLRAGEPSDHAGSPRARTPLSPEQTMYGRTPRRLNRGASLPPRDWSPASLPSLDEEDTHAETVNVETSKRDDHGFIIGHDKLPAYVQCPDPTKEVTEGIENSEYVYWLFDQSESTTGRQVRMNDSDHESDNEKVEFDWANNTHIKQLNDWREQFVLHNIDQVDPHEGIADGVSPDEADIEGAGPEGGGLNHKRANWLQEEIEYLWLLHAQHLEEVLENDPGYLVNGGTLPLEIKGGVLKRWTDDFNGRFANKTHIEGRKIANEPRPLRSSSSIASQRCRVDAIIADFLVPRRVDPRLAKSKQTGNSGTGSKRRRESDEPTPEENEPGTNKKQKTA